MRTEEYTRCVTSSALAISYGAWWEHNVEAPGAFKKTILYCEEQVLDDNRKIYMSVVVIRAYNSPNSVYEFRY